MSMLLYGQQDTRCALQIATNVVPDSWMALDFAVLSRPVRTRRVGAFPSSMCISGSRFFQAFRAVHGLRCLADA